MNSSAKTVLIAEDNPGLAKVLGFRFKAAGFVVVSCLDGHAAWEAFLATRPHAVVSDHEMPGLTGLELCKAIRGVDAYVPLFLVTGRQLELARKGVVDELKLSNVFGKPFSPATIELEVTQAISQCESRSQGNEGGAVLSAAGHSAVAVSTPSMV